MSLDHSLSTLEIMSETDRKKVYIKVNIINDDFAIVSREKHHMKHKHLYCSRSGENNFVDGVINYEMRFGPNRFGIRFDSRSSASESHFYEEYTKIRSKHRTNQSYPSGRIRFEGFKTNSGATGTGIEYYDIQGSPVKYIGEFEDGKYDGEGEFYSSDGNIRLKCKNICAGVPNGKGTFIAGRNKIVQTLEMKDFTDLQTTRDDYTNAVFARIDPDYEEKLALIKFESLTMEDRTIYLFKEIQNMKQSINTAGGASKGSFFMF
jgi:hypothetical protein